MQSERDGLVPIGALLHNSGRVTDRSHATFFVDLVPVFRPNPGRLPMLW